MDDFNTYLLGKINITWQIAETVEVTDADS